MPAAKSKKKSKQKEKFSYKKAFIHYFYCLAVIFLLTIAGVNLDNYINNQKVLGISVDTSPLQNEKKYWENILSQNPSFIDAYLQLAKVEVELGDKQKALNLIQQALTLDPNSVKIIEAKNQLDL